LVPTLVYVKWYGHSCFSIRDSIIVLIDPHDGHSLGLPVPDTKPDIILISHGHDDHASGRKLFSDPGILILDCPCRVEHAGVKIRGVGTFHDDQEGRVLGSNTVFVFVIDGVRFAHLGDVGHKLSDGNLDEMGNVDVLFISVGGNLDLADENLSAIGPKVAIPMHYHVEGIIFPYFQLASVEEFLKGKARVRHFSGSEIEYHNGRLPTRMEVHVPTLKFYNS